MACQLDLADMNSDFAQTPAQMHCRTFKPPKQTCNRKSKPNVSVDTVSVRGKHETIVQTELYAANSCHTQRNTHNKAGYFMALSTFERRRPDSMTGRISLISTLILGTLAVASFTAPSFAGTGVKDTSSLQVQAQSSIEVTPDKATISARLWEDTPAVDLSEKEQREKHEKARQNARDTLEKRAASLIEALEDDTGIAREAISAGSLHVYPRRVAAPKAGDDNTQGEQPKMLTRTRLERPVSIDLDDLDNTEKVLNALMAADVNRLDGVTFDLKDRDGATDEALVKALEKARHKAELMADTLNAGLGRVIHVQETRSPGFAPRMMSVSADTQGKAESAATQPEYRPGTIDIDAGVNVEWALKAGAKQDNDQARDADSDSSS